MQVVCNMSRLPGDGILTVELNGLFPGGQLLRIGDLLLRSIQAAVQVRTRRRKQTLESMADSCSEWRQKKQGVGRTAETWCKEKIEASSLDQTAGSQAMYVCFNSCAW